MHRNLKSGSRTWDYRDVGKQDLRVRVHADTPLDKAKIERIVGGVINTYGEHPNNSVRSVEKLKLLFDTLVWNSANIEPDLLSSAQIKDATFRFFMKILNNDTNEFLQSNYFNRKPEYSEWKRNVFDIAVSFLGVIGDTNTGKLVMSSNFTEKAGATAYKITHSFLELLHYLLKERHETYEKTLYNPREAEKNHVHRHAGDDLGRPGSKGGRLPLEYRADPNLRYDFRDDSDDDNADGSAAAARPLHEPFDVAQLDDRDIAASRVIPAAPRSLLQDTSYGGERSLGGSRTTSVRQTSRSVGGDGMLRKRTHKRTGVETRDARGTTTFTETRVSSHSRSPPKRKYDRLLGQPSRIENPIDTCERDECAGACGGCGAGGGLGQSSRTRKQCEACRERLRNEDLDTGAIMHGKTQSGDVGHSSDCRVCNELYGGSSDGGAASVSGAPSDREQGNAGRFAEVDPEPLSTHPRPLSPRERWQQAGNAVRGGGSATPGRYGNAGGVASGSGNSKPFTLKRSVYERPRMAPSRPYGPGTQSRFDDLVRSRSIIL